jgi:hypothetical protein
MSHTKRRWIEDRRRCNQVNADVLEINPWWFRRTGMYELSDEQETIGALMSCQPKTESNLCAQCVVGFFHIRALVVLSPMTDPID